MRMAMKTPSVPPPDRAKQIEVQARPEPSKVRAVMLKIYQENRKLFDALAKT
jgi:hypothetical protein